jgi:hypothetical protein
MASNQEALDRWLDGEGALTPALEAALASDAELRAYADAAQTLRSAVHQMRGATHAGMAPRIEDAQFRVFMDGIREGMAPQPRWHFGRLWAAVSMVAASLLIASSVFYVFWGETKPVRATDVEEVRTELRGATTNVYANPDGTTTIWVNYSGDDI